ncbi:MAG TPA: ABC transporter substrate-binding protein [Microthrixaceae bacterium]|nr:ABC transporter substrate-binding protein [Microthrixaceae bacterium]
MLLVLALLASGCGDDDDGDTTTGDEGAEEELTPITVGIIPIGGVAPFFYGLEQGYFEDEGLDVRTEIGFGGSEFVPAVLSDEYQFAIGEYLSLMIARENGVGLQVVSNLTNGAERPDRGTDALLVAPDSGIDSVEDLPGKTIAVNGLQGMGEVGLGAILDEHGLDPSSVSFVEVGFPEMNAALAAGEVDVAWNVEPFITLGEMDGLVNLLDPLYETEPSLPVGLVFGSEEWLAENPELASAFHRALQRSLDAATDEEAMREAIAANTETTGDLVEQIALDNWQPEIDRDKLVILGELATRYGILEEEPNLDELIWTAE